MRSRDLNDRPQFEFPLDTELRTRIEDGREMPEMPMKSRVPGVLNSPSSIRPLRKRIEDA